MQSAQSKAPSTPKPRIRHPTVHVPKPQRPKLSTEMENCRRVLRRLQSHLDSHWFHHPVDPTALGLQGYSEKVQIPMDFSTITKKLWANDYIDSEDFSNDVLLVFNNALVFNPPGTVVHIAAQLLKEKFEYEFHPSEDEEILQEKYKTILSALLENPHSSIFRTATDGAIYTQYYKIIKEPIDLSIISQKIKDRQYKHMAAFHADVRKIFNNCFKFNRKNTFGYVAGRELERFYNSINKVKLIYLI
jgi:hypothetical protein